MKSLLTLAVVAIALLAIACGASDDGRDSPALRAVGLLTPETSITAAPDGGSADPSFTTPGGRPAYCVPAEHDTLQDISTTPASAYFVQHPASGGPSTPTVIFLPGGVGSRVIAQRAWANFLSSGTGADQFRLVVPYSEDIDLIDDASRVFSILDEVLACNGGDASQVHIAGTSNGGLAAFALMLARPELFATLLGAPGAFPILDPVRLAEALGDRLVFNGVGANDIGWKTGVMATHDTLVAAGVESVYVEFAGQDHQVSPAFDESVFFEFWARR